jgi:hypothetical protein
MAALTSLIFVGHPHLNSGGIRPSTTIYLEEGSRAAFTFNDDSVTTKSERLIVLPTVEHMLDDLLLMISYHIAKVPEIVDEVETYRDKFMNTRRVHMYEDLPETLRMSLYEKVKILNNLPKIAICIFAGSGLAQSISHLEEYALECEVCTSSFVRSFSSWSRKWETQGNLTQIAK